MFISSELLISEAETFGVKLDGEMIGRFDAYARMLVEYNEKVNLTALTSPDDIVSKHFADSLALSYFVDIKGGMKLADVGTGAGFPGTSLLIAFPGLKVTMFDAVNKKLDFIRWALKELGLEAEVVHMRAEEAGNKKEYRESFDIVTARAVAQLRILSEFCVPLVKQGGIFAPMKGDISEEEKKFGFAALPVLGAELYEDNIYSLPCGDKRNIIIAKKYRTLRQNTHVHSLRYRKNRCNRVKITLNYIQIPLKFSKPLCYYPIVR